MSGAMSGRVGRIAGLELGGHRLANVVATFPDSAFESPRGLDQRNGNLGSGVLGRFNVTLDFGGSRIFLVPNRRFAEPFEWDMSGLVFDMGEGGKVTVAEVLTDSPAAAAGIRPGEELVAVDGAAVEPREMIRQRERFRQPGREMALTLRQNGRERVVKLKLRRLV
jgi:membrane-associated protease RseP (regulator of RpoE activity)